MPHTLTKPAGKAVDWTALRRRLALARETLARSTDLPPERRREILAERAQRAAATRAAPAVGPQLHIVEFFLGRERYAVELRYVRELAPLRQYTPVPGTPPFVVGIMNLRGAIVSVIDLKRFFDLADAGWSELNTVIVLRQPPMEFGILADAIGGVRTLPADAVQALPTLTGLRAEFSLGVTQEALVVLNGARILAESKLIVRGPDTDT